MFNKNTQGKKPNKSKFMPSQEQLNALEAIDVTVGSTITYVFETPRIKYNKEYPDGLEYMHKSRMVAAISPSALVSVGSNGRKLKRNSTEVIRMFEDTREDIGAAYFTIN